MILESGEDTTGASSASSEEIGRGLFAFPRVIRHRHENYNAGEEEEEASTSTTTGSATAGDQEEEEQDPTVYLANFHFAPTHQQECQLS